MDGRIYKDLKKGRPNTWSCQAKQAPTVIRWQSQYKRNKRRSRATMRSSSSMKSLLVNDYAASLHQQLFRHTTITISTVSTTEPHQLPVIAIPQQQAEFVHVFHTQSLLFLFGFLFFPCWWVGGYYLKLEQTEKYDLEERAVHPSLLANGKAYCKTLPPTPFCTPLNEYYLLSTFYKWNRIMSIFSVFLLAFIMFLLIWYFIRY